jgi:hypothetical protein
VTLLAMAITAAVLGPVFFFLFFSLALTSSPDGHGLGEAILAVLLGPVGYLFVIAICTLAVGFFVSGLFWRNDCKGRGSD